ncbi:MAG: PhzF family phenazine biosynthesis protein [Fimbriimonadaceae bacterium]|nr:PhzF family phenazine biosynthesis protein [Fimbriimonadaceae bacterium]
MSQPIFVVDAFTSEAFKGNPAGVCLLTEQPTEDWMQKVAAEMKHAETAFVWPMGGIWMIRWFTPVAEVKLCGHATLASAHTLWESRAHLGDITFRTKESGDLHCRRRDDLIEMEFPAIESFKCEPPIGLIDALGVEPKWVGRNDMDFLVQVADEVTVRGAAPLISRLRDVECRGVIITAEATETDFISRFFAPRFGVDEDSVTGSAHCALAPFWSQRKGKSDMRGYQASARGGYVKVRVDGERCFLSGESVTVLRGELLY